MKRIIVFMVTASTTMSCFAAGYGKLETPGWLEFLMLLMIVWSILEIILFFKIWGMTNNVRKLTKQFCKQAPKDEPKPIPTNPNDYELDDYDRRLDDVKVGDKVRRASDGKILEVVSVGEEALECRGGMLDGIHTYPKDALSIVEHNINNQK